VSAPAPLLAQRTGATLTLSLARPEKMNALSAELVEALLAAVEGAGHDGTRLLVLRGEGRNLSAGFDLGDLDAQSEGDLLLRFVRIELLLQAVRHAPFDTLALAHGRNFGAGADLFAACARRVCAPEASFRMPGLRFGLVLGTRTLAERVGAARAREVLQSAQAFDAAQALAWGFATAVCAQEAWPEAIAQAEQACEVLPEQSAAALFRATTPERRDADLAELVRSAARPGLKERIAQYHRQGR